jgi:endonuclease III related protein
MPTLDDAYSAVHSALVARFGPPPRLFDGLGPFEAICAVLLERNLGSQKAVAALDALRELELLAPDRLATADAIELIDAVRDHGASASAGARAPLQRLARWLVKHHDGRIAVLQDPHRSTGWLRGELASIKGIGLAGADAVLLYALKRPAYPVDRATFRVMARHGWIDPTATYDEARDLVVDGATSRACTLVDRDVAENEGQVADLTKLAHGMDQVGRRYCRPSAVLCEECPLVGFLPEGGYLQFDG